MSQNKSPNLNRILQAEFNNWYSNINLPPGSYQIDDTGVYTVDSSDEDKITNVQDYFDRFYGNDFMYGYYTIDNENTCNHEFTTYQGFTESFEYCKKCDKKKDEIDG